MLLGNSLKVTFNLKSDFQGDATPVIFGSTEELGNGDPNKGIELIHVDNIYNFKTDIIFPNSINANEIWYSYCFRPAFGAIIPETIPKRYMPRLEASAEIFDTIDKITIICDLTVHFHVKCSTEFGQQLYLSGNVSQLGEWDPDSAIQLFYEGNLNYWTCHAKFPLSEKSRTIEYKYFISYGGKKIEWEPSDTHKIFIGAVASPALLEIEDEFRWQDKSLIALTRSPFTNVINKRGMHHFNINAEHNEKNTTIINESEINTTKKPGKLYPNEAKPGHVNIRFNAFCPNVRKNQKLVIIGNCEQLGKWKLENAAEMNDYYFPLWIYDFTLERSLFPLEYKFVIVSDEDIVDNDDEEEEIEGKKENSSNIHKKTFWESKPSRFYSGITSNVITNDYPATCIINNWLVNPNPELFKGFGIYCPLFGLRSDDSCGIGQYTDIKGLVDVCNQIGSSIIRILPIFDTTNKGDWDDSNPYKQISSFALHPIYINLLQVVDNLPKDIYNDIQNAKWIFEQKPTVDYPTVYQYKIKTLHRIYEDSVKYELNNNIEFARFVDQELEWLRPYALFTLLRDKYGTIDFHSWPNHSTITRREINSQCAKHEEELKFIYWVQYICDKQYKEALSYSIEHGVALHSDFLMNINYNSVDTWTWPDYFRLNMCSGAPPNESFIDGKNWGYPTYDWDAMEKDNFHWLELRLRRMSDLFQFLSVDHIIEFFRSWEIPRDSCIRGILGHFNPSSPVDKAELDSRGLFDLDRYLHPYVRWHLLVQQFGEEAENISKKFFIPKHFDTRDDYFTFKTEFNTEKKIEKALIQLIPNDLRKRSHYQKALFDLLSNVMLIHDSERPGCYHVRSNMTYTSSWIELQEPSRGRMKELYEYFVFKRQSDVWLSKAKEKLDFFNDANQMLICAEDFDQKTDQIAQYIKDYGFLSFHVQRISQEKSELFDDISKCNYMSICCSSTHNMMPYREWWEDQNENNIVRDFWKTQVKIDSQIPYRCQPWVLETIIKQHLNSKSMIALFLLQDLTDLVQNLRNKNPNDERINNPSDPNHHWRYRYPFSINEMKNCQEFTLKVRDLAEKSNRI
ncbi:4-alpha-glucanotransferase dpe2 [Tritrichomonas musculus]|uniref:4-alpha-glucanotransferase n=1 Tax=Tritrichomonas musculus TaxID=1915356 RepID=A0ABR2J0M1_9EUKA